MRSPATHMPNQPAKSAWGENRESAEHVRREKKEGSLHSAGKGTRHAELSAKGTGHSSKDVSANGKNIGEGKKMETMIGQSDEGTAGFQTPRGAEDGLKPGKEKT